MCCAAIRMAQINQAHSVFAYARCVGKTANQLLMRMDGYSKMAVSGLGIPFGMPIGVVAAGWSWTLVALKAPYLLDFRHKKGRPWTPLDVYLVEPGGFES